MRVLDTKVNTYVALFIITVFGSGATLAVLRTIELAHYLAL